VKFGFIAKHRGNLFARRSVPRGVGFMLGLHGRAVGAAEVMRVSVRGFVPVSWRAIRLMAPGVWHDL
jgi:hypothetical protein